MKKVLYLMHIDWKWIKQRPQFMAEKLAENNDILCIAPHWYNRRNLQKKNCDYGRIKLHEFYGIPKAKKYYVIRIINNLLRSILTFVLYCKFKPDVIYVAHPELYCGWMKNNKSILLYDCMDDHVALTEDFKVKKILSKKERLLSSSADIICVSSKSLGNIIQKKYNIIQKKIKLVRNGYNGEILDAKRWKITDNVIHIAYIGTVSTWFDFDSIIEAANKGAYFHIIGPVLNSTIIPNHKNIVYEGIVEHKDLYEKIKGYNALIMPFKVNDIVKSVDPVKLYEYINFNKPIISVFYDEIARFEPYVWFYGSNYGSLDDAIDRLKKYDYKYTEYERELILKDSNWDSRASQVEEILNHVQ